MNNSVVKSALKVWLRLIFASVLSFIVWVSINAMGTGFFSEVIGYRVYAEADGETVMISEHIYAEGEDKTAEIKLEEGQTVLNLRETSEATNTAMDIISSVFTLLIYGLFPYNILWNLGSHDENYVLMGRMQKDEHFGLKVGLVANIPSAILYVLLLLGKWQVLPGVIVKWHRILNPAFIPYIDAVENGATTAAELSATALLAVAAILLFVPAVCGLGYLFGYRQISIRERILYKKSNTQ